jgi:hypothetical protein
VRWLAAGAAGLVAVVVVLVFARGKDTPAEPEPVITSSASAAPAGNTRAATLPPSVPAAPAKAAPLTKAETIARLRSAKSTLIGAATPCWRSRDAAAPRGTPDVTLGELRFKYALVVHGGEAEVENVEVVENTITDPDLDTCVRDAVSRAHWPAGGPDGLLEVEEKISIGDLTLPEPPPGAKIR